MKEITQNTMQLSRVIFWDTDYDSIDWEGKAHYVIERVVMYGTIEDWEAIKKFYGLETIRQEVVQSRDLDSKTLNFLSLILDVPKENFRCYTTTRSKTAHWNS